ncbi:endonuclease IV [Ammoniphilus oxalaticus]|uniref:Endonuclease IV n=1 Tax=Ammoniphilus oxalaticus TaxID=66863 RepID=A0A419SQN3_9BACL|nr:deoxyribonuclease IV [Ammoniphilus oxalaticus]RKD26751.1 endonuclease IV [Ammoniphilus oxalaticus]
MKIGCHVSIRKGYAGAAQYAKKIGATSFQYFPKNPRSLKVKSFDTKDAAACARFCLAEGLVSIAHAPYLINLSEHDPHLRETMRASLLNDLEITETCGSIGLVVHFGKYKGSDLLEGYKLMIELLNQVLADWTGEALLLIENNAGHMGATFEELIQVRNLVEHSEKIGFCLDTCHAFASGLWNGVNWDSLTRTGSDYFTHLKAIHLNDSVYPFRSHRDRHANIGQGYIGIEAFRELTRSKVAQALPLILETPQSADYTHQIEIEQIRQFIADGQ